MLVDCASKFMKSDPENHPRSERLKNSCGLLLISAFSCKIQVVYTTNLLKTAVSTLGKEYKIAMQSRRVPKIAVSWWLTLLQALLVRYVKLDESWIIKVREVAERGSIVFVLRNRSLIDFLCLRGLCARYGLPAVSFVSGIWPLLYTPFWLWLIRLFRPFRHEERLKRFKESLASGGSVMVFLRRPAARGAMGSRPVEIDGIRLAVEAQPSLDKSVLALPTVFLWGEHAMKRLPGTMDFLFGSNEYPRLVRSIWLLLRRRSIHELKVGEPLNLVAIRKERNLSDAALTAVIRAGVGRQIEIIRRSRLGSLTKPSSRIKTEVLGSPRLMEELKNIASEEGIDKREITPRARSIIKKLAADFHPRVISLFAAVMAFVWRRIYTGIEVSNQDMEKMRSVVAKGPTLILPTHKSHIDYIVMSQVMQTNNMMLPHIAAGQNLSFWPLGWIFRSSGAFFIRRTFGGDRFYTAVVNTYIRRLIQERYSIEIFIEGGRSRTGKLLRPKLGMLEMAIKAFAATPRLDLQIVPAFIGYERVIEERSYVSESEGHSKKAESIKGLLKSTKVLLSRYGRLFVRIGEPFSLEAVLADMGLTRDDLGDAAARLDVAIEVAMRNYFEINRIAVVTPSAVLATALLTHRYSSIDHRELRDSALWLTEILEIAGASVSDILVKWREPRNGNSDRGDFLDRTIRAFMKAGRVNVEKKGPEPRYSVRDDQRLPLDYYKNNIIHFLVPVSFVCTACLAKSGEEIDIDEVTRNVSIPYRLYGWEFMLNGDNRKADCKQSEEVFSLIDRALDVLAKAKILEVDGARVKIIDPEKALRLSDVLLNYHEIYFAAVTTVRDRAQNQLSGDVHKKSLSLAKEMTANGSLIKPEGHSHMNLKNAIQTFKEMKILRPGAGETPFNDGEIGDRIYRYLESAISIKR
jgi:glycerol-3-phosphate O-acyltransferase